MASQEAPLDGTFVPAPEDIAAITRSSVDYIESWYTADAERMRRCLHPDLAKRGVRRDPRTGEWVLRHTDAARMVRLTQDGQGTETPPPDRKYRVTVLDVFRNTASTKVLSHPFVDYLHLARFRERWVIVNALWEPREQEAEDGSPLPMR